MDELDADEIAEELKELEEERNRLQGRVDVLMERLRDEFGCRTLEFAKRKLKALDAKYQKKYKAFVSNYKKLKAEYGDLL